MVRKYRVGIKSRCNVVAVSFLLSRSTFAAQVDTSTLFYDARLADCSFRLLACFEDFTTVGQERREGLERICVV